MMMKFVIYVTSSTHLTLQIMLALSGWHATRVHYGIINDVPDFNESLTFGCARFARNSLNC